MPATLIDDGYTRDGYIAAAPLEPNGERLHQAVNFKYRVATRRDLVRHEGAIKIVLANELNDPEAKMKSEELACKFVKERLVEWDIQSSRGGMAPITEDSLMRVHPLVFGAMYSMVRGWRVSDPKPGVEAPAELSDEEMVKN